MSRAELAARVAATQEPGALYRELVELNGTLQNMVARRLSPERLEALREFAATQPKMPFSSRNGVEALAIKHLRVA